MHAYHSVYPWSCGLLNSEVQSALLDGDSTSGEIDFIRKPNGAIKINIFDVVAAASAYSSNGTSVPDTNWLPAADLTSQGGKVDIFDIVTITSKYAQEWIFSLKQTRNVQ